jgi:hypothetical protein
MAQTKRGAVIVRGAGSSALAADERDDPATFLSHRQRA